MQDPYDSVLQIAPSPEKVDEPAPIFAADLDGQCFDREIPPEKVTFNGAPFHRRKSRRIRVVFRASRSHIHPAFIRKDENSRTKPAVTADSSPKSLGYVSRQGNSVPFDDDVQIVVFHVK